MVADARISADANPHFLNIRAQPLGQIGDLVHETDFGGQQGVGGVFGQFRRAHVHFDQAVAIAVERRIQRPQQSGGLVIVAADDDPVRAHEVGHRDAFLEKFRVGNHGEREFQTAFGENAGDGFPHHISGADRHGGFIDHDPVAVQVLANGASNSADVLQIRRTILVGRSADRDELEQAMGDARRNIGGESQPAAGAVAANHLIQTRFVDGDLATLQQRHLALVHIDAQHLVADFGKTGPGD